MAHVSPSETLPLVSVVVPTVGRPQLLAKALASVIEQTYDAWEVVVVDEGGLDETRGVVEALADPRVHHHVQSGRVGIVENWGTGVRLARGDYVAILADDDRLRPTFVERRVAALQGRPASLVAFSGFEVRAPDGALVGTTGERREASELDGVGLLREALARRWFIGASLYRREALVELWPRLRDDSLVLDLGLDIRLALLPNARGVGLSGVDFEMLSHPAQSSFALAPQVRLETDDTLRRLAQETRGRERRLIADERARWLTLSARAAAVDGDRATARSLAFRAVGASPRIGWAWRQLVLAWLAPGRLRRSGT